VDLDQLIGVADGCCHQMQVPVERDGDLCNKCVIILWKPFVVINDNLIIQFTKTIGHYITGEQTYCRN
jgi:hypothetical protein